MKLTKANLKKINDYVLSEYPKEAVIAIDPDKKIVTLVNTDDNPNEYFTVDGFELCHKIKAIALIHSHTLEGATTTPSELDEDLQELLCIPFGIVTCDGESVSDVDWYEYDEDNK